MRKPDCILVRVGELALKSRQVQRIWFKVLVGNIKRGLRKKKIDFKFELMKNRIFIYTKDIKKTGNLLKRVFGLTSFSPAWTCYSGMNDIKILACEIAKKILNRRKSFAIRARRVGKHNFTSQTIMEEVGASVKRVTNAKVNLTKPDKTIFVETRSRKTYIFTERMKCAGGLPLGTGGRVLGIINNKQDLLASWLIARKGCELVLLINKKMKKEAKVLDKWHVGRKMKIYKEGKTSEIIEKEDLEAVVIGEKSFDKLKNKLQKTRLLILRPLVCWENKKIKEFNGKICER